MKSAKLLLMLLAVMLCVILAGCADKYHTTDNYIYGDDDSSVWDDDTDDDTTPDDDTWTDDDIMPDDDVTPDDDTTPDDDDTTPDDDDTWVPDDDIYVPPVLSDGRWDPPTVAFGEVPGQSGNWYYSSLLWAVCDENNDLMISTTRPISI
jgi:hypothetical protein